MREMDKRMAEALKEKSAEYPSLQNNNAIYIEKSFGEKSAFYNNIMEDGYVFNPYIHRRWLPAQYVNLVRYGDEPVNEKIAKRYSERYAINFVFQELDKLCLLKRYDRKAFEERRQFFTVECMKGIILEHLSAGLEEVCKKTGSPSYILCRFGYLVDKKYAEKVESLRRNWWGEYDNETVYDWSKLQNIISEVITNVEKADTYFEIRRAFNNFPEGKKCIVNGRQLTPGFIEAFWKSGAYYTVKNEIMFHKKEVDGLKGNAACRKIQSMLFEGATAADFHKIYESMR